MAVPRRDGVEWRPMSHIERQREIVDRRALIAALVALAEQAGREPPRAQVVEIVRQALQDGRAEIRRRFEAGASGTATVRELGFLMDQLIRVLFDFVDRADLSARQPDRGRAARASSRSAAMAAASWRPSPTSICCSCCPTSRRRTPSRSSSTCSICCGISASRSGRRRARSTRCLRQARARSDDPHRAAGGALHLGRPGALRRAEAALRDRDRQGHAPRSSSRPSSPSATSATQRVGDSRYQLEPNVKEGKGGLRDLHTLFWIAKYIYRVDDVGKLVELGRAVGRRRRSASSAPQNFLWTVRCHLHYLTGRAEERLTFDLQTRDRRAAWATPTMPAAAASSAS